MQAAAVLIIVGVLPLDSSQMDHHHQKHGQVQHKYDAEVCHNGYVECYVILQPTTGRKKYRNIKRNDIMKTDAFKL